MENYVVRNLESEDIIEVSKLHSLAFPSDHFTSHFPQKMLFNYFSSLNNENKFNFVIIDENQSLLLGYLIAGMDLQRELSKFKAKNYLNILLVLLKNPRFLLEKILLLIKKFIQPKKSKAKFRVFIFVTNPKFQRKGLGELLLKRLEQDLKKDRINYYGLSVRSNNYGAIKFYKKNGFEIEFSSMKSVYLIKYLK